tara:strand:- start:212 stop:376 length:165 start_codon:yes stop_codon:yes gene_type:complete
MKDLIVAATGLGAAAASFARSQGLGPSGPVVEGVMLVLILALLFWLMFSHDHSH